MCKCVNEKLQIMKNIIIVIFIMVCWSCVDEKDYDFNSVIPGKQVITGDSILQGNGASRYIFYAIPRGGSSYKWELVSGPASIKNDSARAFLVSLVTKSNTDTFVTIKVTETTQGGQIGSPTTKTLVVQKFCEFDIDALVGNFVSNAYEYDKLSLLSSGALTTFSKVKKVADNKLLIEKLIASYPVEIQLNGDANETLSIETYSEKYEDNGSEKTRTITGSGTYNVCKNLIALDYIVTYDNTSNRFLDTLRRQ